MSSVNSNSRPCEILLAGVVSFSLHWGGFLFFSSMFFQLQVVVCTLQVVKCTLQDVGCRLQDLKWKLYITSKNTKKSKESRNLGTKKHK